MKTKNKFQKLLDKFFFVTDMYIPCVEEELQKDGIELVATFEVSDMINRYLDHKTTERDYGRKLLCKDGNIYVALDNSTGYCFTEEFKDLETAYSWLKGDFELY